MTGLITGLAAFLANLIQLEQHRVAARRTELAAAVLGSVATYLEFGEIEEAKQELDSHRKDLGSERETPQDFQLADILVDGFAGKTTKWDSDDPKGRRSLLDRLKKLSPVSTHQIPTELEVLLQYRLPPEGSNVDPYQCPADYFKAKASVFRTPYGMYLAARESHASDPAWARDVLRRVTLDEGLRSHCNLRLLAEAWLAKTCSLLGDFECAQQQLGAPDELIKSCRAQGTTLEVRVRGEVLRLSRRSGDHEEARKQRSSLARIVDLREDEAAHGGPASLNALLYLGWDSFERGDYVTAGEEGTQASLICDGDPYLRGQYPYACSMMEVLRAGARVAVNDAPAAVEQILTAARSELSGMSGGPYWNDEALVELLAAEARCRDRDERGARAHLAAATELRKRIENGPCGTRKVGYSREWENINEKLRHRQCSQSKTPGPDNEDQESGLLGQVTWALTQSAFIVAKMESELSSLRNRAS